MKRCSDKLYCFKTSSLEIHTPSNIWNPYNPLCQQTTQRLAAYDGKL